MLFIGRSSCSKNHENIFGLTPSKVFFCQNSLIEIKFIFKINWQGATDYSFKIKLVIYDSLFSI
ncbi:MAG: hypothetical protein RLZZ69_2830 [Cyanobacteriota bacterium]